MTEVAPGIQEMNSLQSAGFSASEIEQWQAETRGQLQDAGFSPSEVDDYFGVKKPDMTSTKDMFQANLNKKLEAAQPAAPAVQDPVNPVPAMKEAGTFLEAVEAGFDMSVTGLIRGRPDVVLPENAPMFYRIASQVATLAGDVPAMLAGALAGAPVGGAVGGATGSVVPVVGNVAGAAAGTVVGAGAGAMALPEGIRTALMEHYEKGDVQSFGDFWERASAVAINSLKAGAIGGVTAGAGGVVARTAAKVAAPAAVKTSAQLMTEVATMTTVGAALEGKVPEPQEFLDGAVLAIGMHGTVKAAGKLRKMYAKGNVTPDQVALAADNNPKLKQEILASNVEVPGKGEFGIVVPEQKPPEKISTTKPLREHKAELSPEVNTILGKVGEQPTAPKKSMTTSEVYTNLVDRLDPINQATKTLTGANELIADKNPYILARTSVDAKAKAKAMFEDGMIDWSTKQKTGGSLKSALQSVESVDTLEAYMISKRVLEKEAQGLKSGFDVAAAKKVVAEHGAKYEAAAKQVTEFSNGVLKYVADAGILSKEQLARMTEANKDYVPFKRLMDPNEVAAGKAGGKSGSLKEFKGSDRGIQSPIVSIVENTVQLVQLAEQNRPKQALVQLAKQTPGQDLVKSVPDRMQPIKVHANEIIRHLEDTGAITTLKTIEKDLKAKGIKVTDEVLLKAFEKEQGITQVEAIQDMVIFRKQQMDLAPNQFAVFEQGKRRVYETTPELAKAINSLGGDATATNVLFKLMRGITTVKKIGITFTPDFILRNLERDFLTSKVFTKQGLNPLDVLGAMGDIWKKNSTYYEWLKSGGANGAFLDLDSAYVKKDIYKLQRETNFLNSARNIVEKPVEIMRVAAELAEQSLRVAEFKKVRKAGGTMTEGGFASREITVDFQRVGAKISALNSITAFMNVSIQGMDRTARAFKENPTAFTTRALTYITMPSVLLWWANHDDPRYAEIPRWQKDHFWIIMTDSWEDATPEEADGLPEYMVRDKGGKFQINKGTIYRIPKPQELGLVFGSLPERTLEAFFGEAPGALKDFDKSMIGLITPSFVPDAVAPAIEQYFNKSFFTGRDIVPQHLRGIDPEYQFVEYTSETAKTLGKMVATIDKQNDFASPMVLQNYIQSWGGSLGQYAVQVADKALVAAGVQPDITKPTASLADVPFVKSFVVRFPQAGSNSVQDFYDNYEKTERAMNTIKYLAKQGDFKALEKEYELKMQENLLVNLDGLKAALSTQSQLIRSINRQEDLTADEKRQMIDGLYLMMTESAKQGNILIQELQAQTGE